MQKFKKQDHSCFLLHYVVVDKRWCDSETAGYGAQPGKEAISFSSKNILLNSHNVVGTVDIESGNEGSVWNFNWLAGVQNLFLVLGQNSVKEITLSFSLPKGIVSQECTIDRIKITSCQSFS